MQFHPYSVVSFKSAIITACVSFVFTFNGKQNGKHTMHTAAVYWISQE